MTGWPNGATHDVAGTIRFNVNPSRTLGGDDPVQLRRGKAPITIVEKTIVTNDAYADLRIVLPTLQHS